ncbi:UNVERIFIED_CONTAM: hypothetical protein RMT77_007868 [Armadillidium vulgare]
MATNGAESSWINNWLPKGNFFDKEISNRSFNVRMGPYGAHCMSVRNAVDAGHEKQGHFSTGKDNTFQHWHKFS